MQQIDGIVGREPTLRYISSGTAVLDFSVAVNIGYKDNPKTQWIKVTAWSELAEALDKNLKIKDRVYILGNYETNEKGNPKVFNRKDGTTGASFEFKAWKVYRQILPEYKDKPNEYDEYDNVTKRDEIPF